MFRPSLHAMLAVTALGVALGAAAIARAPRTTPTPAAEVAVATLDPFALARLLSTSPPDVVVVALDEPRHALRFAHPASLYGATDDALVENAPHRRLVLVGLDVVRVDRLARRLRAAGRQVQVLAGGVDSWDKAMEQDPVAPAPGADAVTWQTYREHLALRRAFGDASNTPASPVVAPVPVAAPAGAPPKKREGC